MVNIIYIVIIMGIYFSADNNNKYYKFITPIIIGLPIGYMVYTTIYNKNITYIGDKKPIELKNETIDNNISNSYNYVNRYVTNKLIEKRFLHKIFKAPSSVRYDKGLLKNGNIYGEEWKNVYNISVDYLDNRLNINGTNLRIYKDIYSNYSFEYDISYANSNNLAYIFDFITVSITNISNYTEKYNTSYVNSIDKNIDNGCDTVSFSPLTIITDTNLLEINNTTCLKYSKVENITDHQSNFNLDTNNTSKQICHHIDYDNIDIKTKSVSISNYVEIIAPENHLIKQSIYNIDSNNPIGENNLLNNIVSTQIHNKTEYINNTLDIIENKLDNLPGDFNDDSSTNVDDFIYDNDSPTGFNYQYIHDLVENKHHLVENKHDLVEINDKLNTKIDIPLLNITNSANMDELTHTTTDNILQFNGNLFIEIFFNETKLVSVLYKK